MECIEGGYLEIVKWLKENGALLEKNSLCRAVSSGNIELCKWIKYNGCPMKNTFDYEPDSLSILQLLVEWGFRPGPSFFSNAAFQGYFDQMKWAKSQGFVWDLKTCSSAAEGGRLDILQWARERGCPWNEQCCEKAARTGNMEILKWARERDCPWDMKTTIAAARGGHLEIIQWAVDNGCPLPSKITFTTNFKNIVVFEYLLKKGCTVDSSAIDEAAVEGHMETVKWLLKYVSPSVQERMLICKMAASHGDINMLQWTKENGYEWDEETINYAVSKPRAFKWLRDNGCPWDGSVSYEIVIVENVKLLKWALKRKCPVDSQICETAAEIGNIEVMKILLQFNCMVDSTKIARAAINTSNYRLLNWLVKNGVVTLTKELYKMAEGQQEMTEWLVRHNCPN